MPHEIPSLYTFFDGHRRIASGPLETVALAVKRAVDSGSLGPVLIFDDMSGRPLDIDTRGSDQETLARLASHPARAAHRAETAQAGDAVGAAADSGDADTPVNQARSRGRPKLGVVAREVTLLPRHWDWLAEAPGGASVMLRKLVDEAKRTQGEKARLRGAKEAAYLFMSAMAGDMVGFEEATRVLFAHDQSRFRELVAAWPEDVRDHAITLAFGTDGGSHPASPR